jgi:hypothetical protein
VRALGPALVAGRFAGLWIYLVAPLVDGTVAAMVYHRVLAKAQRSLSPKHRQVAAVAGPFPL